MHALKYQGAPILLTWDKEELRGRRASQHQNQIASRQNCSKCQQKVDRTQYTALITSPRTQDGRKKKIFQTEKCLPKASKL